MALSTPYRAFNFTVKLNTGEDPEFELGGFSDVSGLAHETTPAEYRVSKENLVRKIPGLHKVGDVTLKRGLVDSLEFFKWIKQTREMGSKAKRDVLITLRDETGKPVRSWRLLAVVPLRYTGPTLAAKGGGDVAMDELVLSSEGIQAETLA